MSLPNESGGDEEDTKLPASDDIYLGLTQLDLEDLEGAILAGIDLFAGKFFKTSVFYLLLYSILLSNSCIHALHQR